MEAAPSAGQQKERSAGKKGKWRLTSGASVAAGKNVNACGCGRLTGGASGAVRGSGPAHAAVGTMVKGRSSCGSGCRAGPVQSNKRTVRRKGAV